MQIETPDAPDFEHVFGDYYEMLKDPENFKQLIKPTLTIPFKHLPSDLKNIAKEIDKIDNKIRLSIRTSKKGKAGAEERKRNLPVYLLELENRKDFHRKLLEEEKKYLEKSNATGFKKNTEPENLVIEAPENPDEIHLQTQDITHQVQNVTTLGDFPAFTTDQLPNIPADQPPELPETQMELETPDYSTPIQPIHHQRKPTNAGDESVVTVAPAPPMRKKEVKAEELPKSNVNKRRRMFKKTFYKQLTNRFTLPLITSNACTISRLMLLSGSVFSAVAASSQEPPVPAQRLPLPLLHMLCTKLFKTKFQKELFHHDKFGNYRYYIKILYLIDKTLYHKAFTLAVELSKLRFKDGVPIEKNSYSFRMKTPIVPSLTQDAVRNRKADEKLTRMQDFREIKPKGKRQVKRSLRLLWGLFGKRHLLFESEKTLKRSIDEFLTMRYADEEQAHYEVLKAVKDVLADQGQYTYNTYCAKRGRTISEEDPAKYFRKRLKTDIKIELTDFVAKFDSERSKPYFTSLGKEPEVKFVTQMELAAAKLQCTCTITTIALQILKFFPEDVHGLLNLQILLLETEKGLEHQIFWDYVLTLFNLPDGEKICSKMSIRDMYNITEFMAIDYKSLFSVLYIHMQQRLSKINSLSEMCQEKVNIICAKFLTLIPYLTLKLEANQIILFAAALPSLEGKFAAYKFVPFASVVVNKVQSFGEQALTYYDLEIFYASTIQTKDVSMSMLHKMHAKAESFEQACMRANLSTLIRTACASLYPVSMTQRNLVTNPDMVKHYCFSVMASYLYSSVSSVIAYFSHIIHEYLRKCLFNTSYVRAVYQTATYYSSENALAHPEHLHNVIMDIGYVTIETSKRYKKEDLAMIKDREALLNMNDPELLAQISKNAHEGLYSVIGMMF